MKKAENIIELYQNLNPLHVLQPGEDDAQYVPIYGEQLDDVAFDILKSLIPSHTTYIAGQTGTGKTTSLKFLLKNNKAIAKQYEVIHIEGTEYFELSDVSIVDVLLRVAFLVVDKHPELQKTYADELELIKKKMEGRIEETKENSREYGMGGSAKASLETGFSFGLSIPYLFKKMINAKAEMSAEMRNNKEVRQYTREIFTVHKEDLKKLVNVILAKYRELIAPKKLLLVFHDLERMSNIDLIRSLFIEHRQYLEQMECKKVVSVPVVLELEPEFKAETNLFAIKLRRFGAEDHEDAAIERNKNYMRQIVHKRIADGLHLIDHDALDKAINYSGGIIRQYIKVLQNAAKAAAMNEFEQISIEDVEKGATKYKNNELVRFSIVTTEQVEVLKKVRENRRPEVEDEKKKFFIQFLLGTQIIANQNGESWYNLNPLVESTLDFHLGNMD